MKQYWGMTPENPTPIEAFGLRIALMDGMLYGATDPRLPLTASYSDGRPRKWQGAKSFEFRFQNTRTARTTMNLFDMPETKSPRLLWMERHNIRTHNCEDMPEDNWSAWLPALPCSRAVERVWIAQREDGSLVVDPADGRAWPYVKMTPEIIEALTNAGILKTP